MELSSNPIRVGIHQRIVKKEDEEIHHDFEMNNME
jgi:hypothetical protein